MRATGVKHVNSTQQAVHSDKFVKKDYINGNCSGQGLAQSINYFS